TYPFHLWLTKQPDASAIFSTLLLLGVFLFLLWSTDGCHAVLYGFLLGFILSHYRSYKALRHCTAGRIHGPRLDVHCPLPATAPGSIFILRFGGLSPPDLALGGLGVAGKRGLDSTLHERSQCLNRRPHVWYCKGS